MKTFAVVEMYVELLLILQWKNIVWKNIVASDARTALCEAVKANDAGRLSLLSDVADLLVLGSRGLGFVKKMLLGSVSDYCVSHAECPVLIVRGAQPADS